MSLIRSTRQPSRWGVDEEVKGWGVYGWKGKGKMK